MPQAEKVVRRASVVATRKVHLVAASLLRVELSRLEAGEVLQASVPVIVVRPTLNPIVAIS